MSLARILPVIWLTSVLTPILAVVPVRGPAVAANPPDLPQSELSVPPPAAPATSGNPLWELPLKNLTATRERPLFSPSRRPPPPPVIGAPRPPPPPPAAAPTGPEKPQLTLVGAIAGDASGIAVFVDETTKDVIRLRTGEGHKGWVLRTVRPREAVLENGDETAIVALPAIGGQR